jgi:carboxypeptidase PM20D1
VKKIILSIVAASVIVLGVLIFNTLMLTSKQVASESLEHLNLPNDVFQNLSKGLQYPTISYSEDSIPDSTAFFGFHRFLEETFPLTHASLSLEKINTYSLLYTWEGSDASKKPIILMAHQDVVPVDHHTLEKWEADPFAGKITDTHIIGRGALDDKGSLMSLMESVEKLLEESFIPNRTIYLAFGHDEEVGGKKGASEIASYLNKKGIKAAMTLDEGGSLAENLVPGINKVALINLAEKGYVSFRLTVETNGGHSSRPPRENTIGILAKAIVDLENNQLPYRLVAPINYQLEYRGAELPFFDKLILANPWLFKNSILEEQNAHTTTAPTIIEGGVKDNVIPTVAEATINFRILPGETIESVKQHVQNTISNKITVKEVGFATNPSPVSGIDSENFKILEKTIRSFFPNVVVVPGLSAGGTDARYFYEISDDVYRFNAKRYYPGNVTQAHGIDEKISKENYKEMIEFTYHLIKKFN